MKKLIIIIFISVITLFAQGNNKGRISFIFNGEKIDLPFTSVTLIKQDHIILNARAEHNVDNVQQMAALKIGFKKLASGDSSLFPLIRININLRDNSKKTGNDLAIQYDHSGLTGGNGKNEAAHYGVFNRGERVSWDINKMSLRFNITSVLYIDNELKISGSFSGTFSSVIAPKGQVVEIKDGKFEIII
jgi:hypothetical protein